MIIYVDNFMLLGGEDIARRSQNLWKTSDLQFLTPTSLVRFLGMELEISLDEKVILVNQTAYIDEILRACDVPGMANTPAHCSETTTRACLPAIWAACHQRERFASLPMFELYICAGRQVT